MYPKSKQPQPVTLIWGRVLPVKLVIVKMIDTMHVDARSTEFEGITIVMRKYKFLIFMLGYSVFLNLFEKYMELLPLFYFVPESSSAL